MLTLLSSVLPLLLLYAVLLAASKFEAVAIAVTRCRSAPCASMLQFLSQTCEAF